MSNLKVIYLPFQIPTISETVEHAKLLETALSSSNHVVVALPVKRIAATKHSPLDYFTRAAMIHNVFPNVGIVPVLDQKYPADQVAALETAVSSLINPFPRLVTLFTWLEFHNLYASTGGNWQMPDTKLSFFRFDWLKEERKEREDVRDSYVVSEDFRRGAIYALGHQYPATVPTVDIAIHRTHQSRTQLLLGRKPGEHAWRFPGGYVDRRDDGYAMTALREAQEETKTNAFTSPRYLGSRRVSDWRYAGERDGITTTLFEVEFYGLEVEAGDDLAELKWFEPNELKPELMEGEHKHLLEIYLEAHPNSSSANKK